MLYIKFDIASFLLTGISFGFLNFIFLLFISKNHQVTDDITLSLQVEKILISQKVQTFLSFILAHKACAQSSITIKLFFLAIFIISGIFEGFQKVC